MRQTRKLRRNWLNFLVTAQKRWLEFQKSKPRLVKSVQSFLKIRYWPIYLLAFSLGFYLWGPANGIQKLKTWRLSKSNQLNAPIAKETLQQELNRLKEQLQQEQLKQKAALFSPASFTTPIAGQVTQGFAWVYSSSSWHLHPGVDLEINPGSKIAAAAAGTISKVTANNQTYEVRITHGNGWESVYQNLAKVLVQPEQIVNPGEIIGISSENNGDSAKPSLHFGIYHNGQPIDPGKIITSFEK